jgi:hypothetical protein
VSSSSRRLVPVMDLSTVDNEIEATPGIVLSQQPSNPVLPKHSMMRLLGFSFFWLGVSAINASVSVLLVVERVRNFCSCVFFF